MGGNPAFRDNVPPWRAAFYRKCPSAPKAVEMLGTLLLNWTWSDVHLDTGRFVHPELFISSVNAALPHSKFSPLGIWSIFPAFGIFF